MITKNPTLVSWRHSSRVCQGCYSPALLRAWEDWDAKNDSENDNPKEFPSDQVKIKSLSTTLDKLYPA